MSAAPGRSQASSHRSPQGEGTPMNDAFQPHLTAPLPGSLALGMIGNCAISALVDAQARMVWCCLPRFDGDPVFNALLEPGEDASHFAIEVENLASTEQHYEPNTAILRTRLLDQAGHGIEISDFAPRFFSRSRVFRPMTLVRRVRLLQGSPRIRVVLKPRFDWGQSTPRVTRGSNHIRFVGEHMTLRLSTDAPVSHVLSGQPYVLTREQSFILGADETLDHGIADTARMFEQETLDYWRHWSQRLAVPLEWQEAVIRAAITLKLSLFEDTGAIVAAMTTSIPESAHSGRNWDYRYCWLRDAFFVVRALNSLSEVATMEDYLRWLGNVVVDAGSGHIQPLYGIGLERELPESTVPTLAGYRGMGPVRVGNQAAEHFQHDVYGNIILGAAQAFHDHRLLYRAGTADFTRLELVGEQAVRVYGQPDAGMWELRTRAQLLERPRGTHAARNPGALLEREAPGLRRELRRPRTRRQRAADGRGRPDRRARPTLRQHRRGDGKKPVRRSLHAPLRGGGRFRQTRNRIQHLHLLAHRRPGAHRPPAGGAGNLRNHAGRPQPARPAVGRHASGERRNVGQLPANVFHGGHHQRRSAALGPMGQRDLRQRPTDRRTQPGDDAP